jgi:hypothetical protein
MRLLVCLSLANLLITFSHVQAAARDRFSVGATELEVLAGVICSVDSGKPSKPTVNFAQETLRFGIMLTDARRSGFFPGNTELLVEAFGGEIYTDAGTAVAAANFLLRRNFIIRDSIFVPYAQMGGGGAYSDLSRTQSQALLGSELNFSVSLGAGLRVLLSDRCSLLVEHDFEHFSNAGTTHRNHGLNSLGGQAGLAFSF